MISYLKYRLELLRLRRVLSKHNNKFGHAHDEAKQRGFDDGELSSLGQEIDEIENWIKYQQTQYLESVCNELVIPMPEDEIAGNYYRFNFDDNEGDRLILTTAGMQLVRINIREERKARREVFGFWISMIIGLLGTVIGLVSALK
jgi:hypothetical protein